MSSPLLYNERSPELQRLRSHAAMSEEDARRALTRFGIGYMLHPWTLAPLLLTLLLLPFIAVDTCGPRCANAVARLGLPEGTDLLMIFLLLSLLTLPLCVNAMWSLSSYCGQRRAWHVLLRTQLEQGVAEEGSWRGGSALMLAPLCTLGPLLPLLILLGAPEPGTSRLETCLWLTMAWALWHGSLALIFEGCIGIAAGFDVRAEQTRICALTRARMQALLRAQKRARGR